MIKNGHSLDKDLINRYQSLRQMKQHIFAYVFSALIHV